MLENNTTPESGTEVSTLPADLTGDDIVSNLDTRIDEIFGPDVPEESAAEVPEEEVVEDQVSEEEELESADDESNIEEGETEEVSEQDASDLTPSLESVTLDDLKENNQGIVIDGKVRDADAIASAFARQTKQEEARNEVETAREALEQERVVFEAQRMTEAGRQELTKINLAEQQLVQARDKALAENNSHDLTMINTRLQQIAGAKNQVQNNLNQSIQQQGAMAAQQLEKYGFGDINTDEQRKQAFVDYAYASVPQDLITMVNTSPEMLALVEKARLYDKTQTTKKSGKLKVSSTKSLKSRAGNVARQKKVSTDPIQSKIDKMFASD